MQEDHNIQPDYHDLSFSNSIAGTTTSLIAYSILEALADRK